MQWNTKADRIRSVEFYRMFVQTSLGRLLTYHGAVVFGPPRDKGCEVLRVAMPTPNPQLLYEQLGRIHAAPPRERLIFVDWSRSDVIASLQAFCQQGLPLPDVFDDAVARLEGLTVFQLACYQQACRIPHGETRSYAWLAGRMKKFGAERAVGGAMKANPFPLLIPCHRVVNKDGNLGGFMGTATPESWQLGLKKTLLEVEGLHRQPTLFALHAV
jgi:O-6-methylguanine DNA methyltransferase